MDGNKPWDSDTWQAFQDKCAALAAKEPAEEYWDLDPCPDCGACPKLTRCMCDFAGVRVQRRIAAIESQLAEGTARLDEQRTRIAAFIREKSASAKWDWEVRHFADHAAEQIEHGWDGEGEAAIDAARKERT